MSLDRVCNSAWRVVPLKRLITVNLSATHGLQKYQTTFFLNDSPTLLSTLSVINAKLACPAWLNSLQMPIFYAGTSTTLVLSLPRYCPNDSRTFPDREFVITLIKIVITRYCRWRISDTIDEVRKYALSFIIMRGMIYNSTSKTENTHMLKICFIYKYERFLKINLIWDIPSLEKVWTISHLESLVNERERSVNCIVYLPSHFCSDDVIRK